MRTLYSTNQHLAVVSTMAESPWGGSEELWAQVASAAIEGGATVTALLPVWPELAPKVARLTGIGMRATQWTERGTDPELNIKRGLPETYPWQLLLDSSITHVLVSHGGFQDIIHGHQLLAAVLINIDRPFSAIIQCNTDFIPFLSDQHRHFLRNYLLSAERVWFVSEHNRELAQRLVADPLSNSGVTQNPVNLVSFEREPFPSLEGEARFATIARLDVHAKGFDILFSALSSPPWVERHWHLDIYGSGIHEQYVRELISMFSLQHRVTLQGSVDDIRAVWRNHHALLLASRYEGTPLVLLEAMACGRPVVATNVGGNAEWITDGDTGAIAEAPTPQYFRQALERFWSYRDSWEKMSQRAHEVFCRKHLKNPGRHIWDTITDSQDLPTLPKIITDSTTVAFHKRVPEVSVVIPCYNYGELLPLAVLSIVNQTFTSWEIIIVDDGSTDSSATVCDKLLQARPDLALRVIRQENSGQPAIARNTGIHRSRGKYIICLDADDEFESQMLEKCVEIMEQKPEVSLVYTNGIFLHPDGSIEFKETGIYSPEVLRDANQLFYCTMYRRAVFDAIQGYRTNVPGYEDWDFWLAAALRGFKADKVHLPLLRYRVNDHGMFAHGTSKDAANREAIKRNNPEAYLY